MKSIFLTRKHVAGVAKKLIASLCIVAISFITSSAQKPTAIAAVIQTNPTMEDVILYRIQFKITTGVGNDAGTDQGASVQMNDGDKPFYLARSIDNFEEGHTDTYDFLSSSINTVRDIKYLRFQVKGDDGWCAKMIAIYFNNSPIPVFVKQYPGRGNCIDNKASFTISSAELRSYAGWKLTSANRSILNPPAKLSKATLLSMVEAAIGNQMNYESGIEWGTDNNFFDTRWGPAVEVNFKNDHTLHFDLDLQMDIFGPNPELDVDFDLKFTCENGVLKTEVDNIVSSTNYVGKAQSWIRTKGIGFLAGAIGTFFGHPEIGVAGGGLLSKFLDFKIAFSPGNPNLPGSCSNLRVLSNGDVVLK